MQIVHVVPTLNRGGTEICCRNLASDISEANAYENVFVAMARGGGEMAPELGAISDYEISVLRNGRVKRKAEVVRFYRLCCTHKPAGLILYFFGIDTMLLAYAARLAGVRNILMKTGNSVCTRGLGIIDRAKYALITTGTALAGVPVVFSSNWLSQSNRALGPYAPGSCVIPNGCDVPGIAAEAERARRLRTDQDAFVVGMVARLDSLKDHATLLAAIAHLRHTMPEQAIELRLIGDGPNRRLLEQLVSDLGLRDVVTFFGSRSDIANCLGGLDLFVLSTTEKEGFGIVLIEALAAGVPVVASDVPACREVLRDGGLGRLVEAGDMENLAGAIADAIRDGLSDKNVPTMEHISQIYGIRASTRRYLEVLGLAEACCPEDGVPGVV